MPALPAFAPTGTTVNVTPSAPPGSSQFLMVVGWGAWIVFAICVAGVLIICGKMASSAHRNRSGDGGGEQAGDLFWPLMAAIIASVASGLIGAVS